MLFSGIWTIVNASYSWHTLGTRAFFVACDEEICRPQADPSSAEGRRYEWRSREKETSGAERVDLPCWMDLDLVSNLSIAGITFLSLDRNLKPRMKSLWHAGYSWHHSYPRSVYCLSIVFLVSWNIPIHNKDFHTYSMQ